MQKVFIDTNILLDHLLERTPFADDASEIMELAEANKIKVYTSTVSFVNTFYIIKKIIGHHKTLHHLKLIERLIELIEVNQKMVQQALDKPYKDFEDGIQMEAVMHVKGITCIVTRNSSDFKLSTVPIITPKDFLASL
ncbi:MAG: PIN domain-containing protein [Bacteroidota bacterium]